MKGGSAAVYAVAHPKKKTTQRLVTSKLRITKLAKPNSSKCNGVNSMVLMDDWAVPVRAIVPD